MFERNVLLAAYASQSAESRGRLISEPCSPTRSDFQRDRDRIIHCTAFRRLAHKTQVFVPHEGDHFRTRLTHTIEVSQIARALARALGLDEDLAEALALAHDLGHPPFGHAGEDVLNECLKPVGGFDHNAQALRIVTKLEKRYAVFDGLNLSWETLEGLVKHNGPLVRQDGQAMPRFKNGLPAAFLEQESRWPLNLHEFSSGEAQVAALADDIAYNAHDLDDGLRAGLFQLEDLNSVDFLKELLGEISGKYPSLEFARIMHELGRRVITRLVEDVIAESWQRLATLRNVTEVRVLGRPAVAFSPAMAIAERSIKAFLHPRMYRHPKVMKVRLEAADLLQSLFAAYAGDPGQMPGEWAREAKLKSAQSGGKVLRVIGDYMAGMTDRYAIGEYARLIGPPPSLR